MGLVFSGGSGRASVTVRDTASNVNNISRFNLGTTLTKIVNDNPTRKAIILLNEDKAKSIELGIDNIHPRSVILPGQSKGYDCYTGEIWGLNLGSGTVSVYIEEVG